jgi:hypothetical protein
MQRAVATGRMSPGGRARAQLVTALLGIARGDASRISELTVEAIRLARAGNDREILAHALTLGALASLDEAGQPAGADAIAAALREALALSREIGDAFVEAHALIAFSQVDLLRCDIASAESFLAEAERIARAEGNWFTLTDVLLTRARADLQFGSTERAEPALLEGLRLCGKTRDIWTAELTIVGLAIVAARTGDNELAVRLFGSADALREQTGTGLSWATWRDLADEHLAIARSRVGAPAFATLWAEGRSLGLDGAIEMVRDESLQGG